jgi:sensor histidine kinase YesM
MNRIRGLRNFFFIVTSIFFVSFGVAQSNIDLSKLDGTIPFQIFKTQNESLSINQILSDSTRFRPPSDFKDKTTPKDIFWIRLDLSQNDSLIESNDKWFLTHNSFDHAELYYWNNKKIGKRNIGKLDSKTAAQPLKSAKYFSETQISSDFIFKERFIYLKLKRVTFLENIGNWEFGHTKDSIKNIFSWNDVLPTIYSYIFSGIAGLMTIIMLVFFGYFKKLEFLMYSLYTFFMLLYAIKDEFVFLDSFLPNYSLLKIWLFEDITFLIGIAYLGFTIHYLNLKKEHRLFCKIVVFSIFLHILFFIIDMAFYLLRDYMAHIQLMKALPIWDSLFSVLIAVYVLAMSKKMVNYLYVLGLAAFMIGVGLHFYLTSDGDPMRYYNKLSLYIGSTIEIIIFAFGLIYKLFLEHIERLSFEKEAFINKNKALRAQINPHFIFNALGSIQHLILHRKNDSALKYLTKFSRMARNSLEASIEDSGTLEEEIEMLKDYLDLESLRFDNAFSFNIQVDDQLRGSEIEIPFMVSQPFVENAIIHGLLPKESVKKELSVTFKKEMDSLACIIDDSGIGRVNRKTAKTVYQNKRKSRGIEIALSRLKNWKYGPGKVEIIDKYDDNNNPSGTKIIIIIPIK